MVETLRAFDELEMRIQATRSFLRAGAETLIRPGASLSSLTTSELAATLT
jgi:hypothetical protein